MGLPKMNAKQLPAETEDYRDYDDALDWLGLTPEERAIVELRLAVARAVRTARERQQLTQGNLAERIGSSQSRVAKVESAAKGVSLDLAFKALFAAGGHLTDLMTSPKGRTTKTPARPKKVGKR